MFNTEMGGRPIPRGKGKNTYPLHRREQEPMRDRRDPNTQRQREPLNIYRIHHSLSETAWSPTRETELQQRESQAKLRPPQTDRSLGQTQTGSRAGIPQKKTRGQR